MPYIKPERRKYIAEDLKDIYAFPWETMRSGDINFIITSILRMWAKDMGDNYSAYNTIIGVLECIKLELYRRLIAPYENKKCRENGDVYC